MSESGRNVKGENPQPPRQGTGLPAGKWIPEAFVFSFFPFRVPRSAFIVIFVGLAVAFGRWPALGATLDVGGTGPFVSIQQAVDMAQPGDTVRIATGTYFESVTIRKSLTVLGGFDPAHATRRPLSSSEKTRVFARSTTQSIHLSRLPEGWFFSPPTEPPPHSGALVIQGNTIRRIEIATPMEEGFHLSLDQDSDVTSGEAWLVHPHDAVFRITDEATTASENSALGTPLRVHLDGLVIIGGRADRSDGAMVDSGGGVNVASAARTSFTLTRCELIYNFAARMGGAVAVQMNELGRCRITSSSLMRNDCFASSESAGGALAIRLARGSDAYCSGNRISLNRSAGDAGGVDLEADSGCFVRFARNAVTSNTAQENAGGLAARLGLLSVFESVGCQIEGNRAASGWCGGGYVELEGNSQAWLKGDHVRGNVAEAACGGLGIWADTESQCEISGAEISRNESGLYGGLHVSLKSASGIVLSETRVTTNSATAGDIGGLSGQAQQGSEIEMTSVTIAANRAENDCGGVDLAADESSSLTISQCDFTGNEAVADGGAGRFGARRHSFVGMTGCRFLDNFAARDSGAGDFILQSNSSLSLKACRFERNEAGRQNGFGSVSAAEGTLADLNTCTFADNRSRGGPNGAGTFDFRDGSLARLDTCLFIGNRSAGDSGVGRFNFVRGSWAEFTDCQFRDNVTSGSGGVGFLQAVDNGAIVFRRCDVTQNETRQGPYGAFCIEGYFGSLVTFDDTAFEDNLSSGPFGALYVYCDDRTPIRVFGCHFSRNRAAGGGYGACAIEAQRDSPVTIAGTTVSENLAIAEHGGLYVSAAERSPVVLSDCRLHHNVALGGGAGALTIFAEDRSTVSLQMTDCWSNRAHGDAGAVSLKVNNDCPMRIEDCDWFGNMAWREETEPVALEEANGLWRIAPKRIVSPEPGDLVTQGSATWAVAGVRSDETSTTLRLSGRGRPLAGQALLRHVTGDGGAFVLDQRGGGNCLLSGCRVFRNRAGRDHGAGTLTTLDSTDVQVRDCMFSENTAGRFGGAAGFWFGSVDRAILERNTIEDNLAGSREEVVTGGYCGGFDLYGQNSRLQFSGNGIRGNRSLAVGETDGNWGGGLMDTEEVSVLEMINNEIARNQAEGDIGGLEIGCHDLSVVTARDNLFADNRAGGDFGALSAGADSLSPVTIEENTFRSNRAGGCGGALGLMPTGSQNGYSVVHNRFVTNVASMGSAAYVAGPAAFENNIIAQNSALSPQHSGAAVAFTATDASMFNDTLTSNPGTAVLVVGGAIRVAARLSLETGLQPVIEVTSPSIGAMLLCARLLPTYLVQGPYIRRILEAAPDTQRSAVGTQNSASRAFRLHLESNDGLTTGACRLATEVQRLAVLTRVQDGWSVEPLRAAPSPPAPGDRIIQGLAEHAVVDVAGESPPYLVALDDDTGLAEGGAILATPRVAPASLQLTSTTIQGSLESLLPIGHAVIKQRR
jgi:hypothetical protein